MLQEILKTMANGEAMTQRDLAQDLDVPEPMVSQMVAQLVQQGYLKEADECAITCESCGHQSACGALASLRVWSLTEKGWRAAQR